MTGQRFGPPTSDLTIGANGSRAVVLPFAVNFGSGLTNVINVFENGFIGLSAPRLEAFAVSNPGGFAAVDDLRRLGIPVIAPFYSNLVQGRSAGNGSVEIGDIAVQFGSADPYADEGGMYTVADLRPAAKITWYGLRSASASCGEAGCLPVFAELLITAENGTDSNVEFRYGPDFYRPGQDAQDALAGFAVGDNFFQFRGPFGSGIPSFFEFRDGLFVGDVSGAVPEPATWLQLLTGFGLLGLMMRARRRRAARSASGRGAALV